MDEFETEKGEGKKQEGKYLRGMEVGYKELGGTQREPEVKKKKNTASLRTEILGSKVPIGLNQLCPKTTTYTQ